MSAPVMPEWERQDRERRKANACSECCQPFPLHTPVCSQPPHDLPRCDGCQLIAGSLGCLLECGLRAEAEGAA